jgi:hypothetical protein
VDRDEGGKIEEAEQAKVLSTIQDNKVLGPDWGDVQRINHLSKP